MLEEHLGAHENPKDWDLEGLHQQLKHFFNFEPEPVALRLAELRLDEIADAIWVKLIEQYDAKEEKVTAEVSPSE